MLVPAEMELCRRSDLHWFHWWAWTYNPKLAAVGELAYIPFDLYPRQVELIDFLNARVAAQEEGLVEKSRDMGFTYLAGGWALHKWLFVDGFKTTFGSRKSELVDRIGDPDSILEKVRMMLRMLPPWMMPDGFNWAAHDNFMRIANPHNGNTIRGEAGDEMGRGGRSTAYILDEASFYERAERVEVATGANADVRIWGSTVNGNGNLFARKRHGGSMRPEQIFRLHWTSDPRKNSKEWEIKTRASYSEEWMFASEYDIDYSASVEGICIPGKWIEAAKRLKHVLPQHGLLLEPEARGTAGLDIGAGKAKSVFSPRFGPIVLCPTAWGDPDTTDTALKALDLSGETEAQRSDGRMCRIVQLNFDEPGVGKGVLSTLSRHGRKGLLTVPINTGNPPSETMWPDGKTSEERFGNSKAEVWFLMREKFKATYEMLLYLDGKDAGIKHALTDLISLPDDTDGPEAQQLANELSLLKWNRNEKGKIVMETKIALAKRGIRSPDYADALALTFRPETQMVITGEILARAAMERPRGRALRF